MNTDAFREWLSEISQQLKTRFGDVFFSYFVVFEVIFNWKFLYTLISDGEPKNVAETVVNAERFINLPGFFQNMYEVLDSPSNFYLAIISSLFMTVAYPAISSLIVFIRKMVLYWSNQLLRSGFPTNEEYHRTLKDYSEVKQELDNLRSQRTRDLGALTRYIGPDSPIKNASDHRFVFCLPQSNYHFVQDEICQMDSSNNCLIQKINQRSIQRDRLGIIIEDMSRPIYLCATGVNKSIPITQKMVDSGKAYYGFSKRGKPVYFDVLDEEMMESLLLSVSIEGVGEIVEVKLHM